MIPVISGFSNLGLDRARGEPVNTIFSLGVAAHPLGKCVYAKTVPHWAISGVRYGIIQRHIKVTSYREMFISPHVFTLSHPDAFTVALEDGFIVVTRSLMPTADILDYHCAAMAQMPAWDVLKNRYPSGTVSRGETLKLLPELQRSVGSGMHSVATSGDLEPEIGAQLEALVAAGVSTRTDILKSIVGPATAGVNEAVGAQFIALDENHWLPVFFGVLRTDIPDIGGGLRLDFSSSFLPAVSLVSGVGATP